MTSLQDVSDDIQIAEIILPTAEIAKGVSKAACKGAPLTGLNPFQKTKKNRHREAVTQRGDWLR